MKEKKNYEYPELEIIHLKGSDVIATSNLSNDDNPTNDADGWA